MLLFPIIWFLTFFIPGDNLLRPLSLNNLARFTLATILGIALWALAGYVFGYLGARWLIYFYILVNLLVWFKFNFTSRFKPPAFNFKKTDWSIPIIIIGGSIFNLTAVWFMATNLNGGVFFCCRGVPDAIYHLALTNQIVQNFPPHEPGNADVLVKNYHLLSNLVVADLSRVFKIDIATLYFRYMSLLLALLLGASGFVLAQILNLKTAFGRWLALFLYASGDILYVLLFMRGDGFNFDVTILDDATKLLAGPPRAFSIVLFLGGLCFLSIWLRRRRNYAGFLAAIALGSLIGFKVYTGIFALVGLGFLGVYFLLKKRLMMIFPLLSALIISLVLYLPTNSAAGGLKFNGFWRFENFVLHKDLKIAKLEYSRLEQISHRRWYIVTFYELLFVILYFAFLFGTINLALFQSKKSLLQLPKELNIFLISGLLVTIILGAFFVQVTGGANTVQFIIGAFIIGGIYAALAIYFWLKFIPKPLMIIAAIVIILLTSGRGIYEVYGNINSTSNKTGIKISKTEMDGLLYLRNNTPQNSKVLLSEWMSEEQLFIYVSYFSNRPMFLASSGLLRDHGFDTSAKQEVVRRVMNSQNEDEVRRLLLENNVSYLFYHSEIPQVLKNNQNFLPIVFSNNKVAIYQVI